MTSTAAVRPPRGLRGIGLATIIVGIVFIVAGGVTWFVVQDELSSQDITVSKDASFMAGSKVEGPLTAYSEAKVIAKHVSEMSGGKTYAEMPQNDPKRDTVAQGSFLQASLYTSVIAFGVAVLVVGLGVMFIIFGIAFRKVGGPKSPAVATQTASGGLPTHAAGQHLAPTSAGPAGSSSASVASAPTTSAATATAAPAAATAQTSGTQPSAPADAGPSEAAAWTRSVAATPPQAAAGAAGSDTANASEPSTGDEPSGGDAPAPGAGSHQA